MDGAEPYAALVDTINSLSARWEKYRLDSVDLTIAPGDDMFVQGGLEHYLFVGTSALEVISEAMLLAQKPRFANILDLPCGFGRVTRHLVKFFHDSRIFVSEIDKAKEGFCSSQFGAQRVDVPPDFSGESTDQYDLIFVGSLLTHFNVEQSIKALHYLLKALPKGGLLIFTTHGRYAAGLMPKAGRQWRWFSRDFMGNGFGYLGDNFYGASAIAPSWILRVLESFPDAQVLGHMEQGWASHQDVFIVQKKAIGWAEPRPAERAARWRLGSLYRLLEQKYFSAIGKISASMQKNHSPSVRNS